MTYFPFAEPPPWADELRLPPLAEFLASLAAPVWEQDATEAAPEGGARLDSIAVDLPFELDLCEDAAGLGLEAAPPTQRTRTTYLPVLHRLRLRITYSDGGLGDQPLEA